MHNRFDQFAKNLTRDTLSRASIAETEVEVLAATQKIDVYSTPDPAREAARAEMGLLGRLSARPTIFEPFRSTPGLRLARHCIRKQLTWAHELERRARAAKGEMATVSWEAEEDDDDASSVPFPALVLVSRGRPETTLRVLGFHQEEAGVYRNAPGFETRIVVLSELPRSRDTLMLRLLGSGKVFRDALADLNALPAGAWEKSVATPLLIHFRLEASQEPPTQENDMNAEIQAWWEEYQRNEQQQREEALRRGRDEGLREGRNEGRNEGRKEGERRLLLRLLRARFGELPAGAVARIEAAEEADLEQWGERVVHAQALADVLDEPS